MDLAAVGAGGGRRPDARAARRDRGGRGLAAGPFRLHARGARAAADARAPHPPSGAAGVAVADVRRGVGGNGGAGGSCGARRRRRGRDHGGRRVLPARVRLHACGARRVATTGERIAGLQRTLRWLRKGKEKKEKEEGEVEYLGTKLLDEATKRDQGQEHQQIGVESGVQACRIESGDDDRAGESGTKYGGDFVVLVKKAGSLTTEAEGEVISRQTFDEESRGGEGTGARRQEYQKKEQDVAEVSVSTDGVDTLKTWSRSVEKHPEQQRLNARNGSGDIHCHENHGTDYSSSATPFPGTETKDKSHCKHPDCTKWAKAHGFCYRPTLTNEAVCKAEKKMTKIMAARPM